MMTDRLSLVQYSANDLRNAGFVAVDGEGAPLDAPDDLFLAIPEHQLDLSDGKREQFEKECRAVGAFWLLAVDGEGAPLDAPDDLFLAIPEHQLDLSDGKREQFEKECRAVGAFWLPRAGE